MLESEKLAIAAHLHVVMRRKMGRVTDVEWMVRNADYAREVIRVAKAEKDHAELQEWASRLQEALFPVGKTPHSAVTASNPDSGFVDSRLSAPRPAKQPDAPRYVGSLR